MLFLAMVVAFGLWNICMKQLGKLLASIDAISEKQYTIPRLWVCIIVYSIIIILFNKEFKKISTKIVVAENLKYNSDHENSLIRNSYTLGFWNSYLGMSWAAFVDQLLAGVCGLLLSVLMLKQIIMNLIDLYQPKCKQPKRFNAHKMQILDHYAKYPGDYGSGENADSIWDKQEHYEAEKQTLMGNMAPFLVPKYNELFMQLGWILFFSMVFPIGSLFTIFAGLIRMQIELTDMS